MNMTEILQSPPQLSSSSSSIPRVPLTDNDGSHQQTILNYDPLINSPPSDPVAVYRTDTAAEAEEEVEQRGFSGGRRQRKKREREEGDQLSPLAVLVTVFRKSLVACRTERVQELSSSMEIGLPTNVRHVAHVTFDRFNGFLGLPVEFEPEVPRRPPSASTSVFGVSTESMQLSFDSRGNSVPTILLMMQRRLYAQGGLQAEGIFRINAENGQEEYVREQLNRGVVPDDIDVHCLAGLIKAWFRELPNGMLDSLSPEQVMLAQSEEECAELVRLLPPIEAALLDWAVNLMADVVQMEHLNKMSARNIAMVFAPNMTQMSDPLTALMHAVQVMNFLKTLIIRTLREREDSLVEPGPTSHLDPFDENGSHGSSQLFREKPSDVNEEENAFLAKEPLVESPFHPSRGDTKTANETPHKAEIVNPGGKGQFIDSCPDEAPNKAGTTGDELEGSVSNLASGGAQLKSRKNRTGQSSNWNIRKGSKKINEQAVVHVAGQVEKSNKESSIARRLSSRTERVVESWR